VTVQASDVPGSLVDRKQEMFRVRLDGTGQRRLTEDEAEDVGPSAVP
jgi:hypothetical protein